MVLMPLDGSYRNTDSLFKQAIFVVQRFIFGVLCVSFLWGGHFGGSRELVALSPLTELTCVISHSFPCKLCRLTETSLFPYLADLLKGVDGNHF